MPRTYTQVEEDIYTSRLKKKSQLSRGEFIPSICFLFLMQVSVVLPLSSTSMYFLQSAMKIIVLFVPMILRLLVGRVTAFTKRFVRKFM